MVLPNSIPSNALSFLTGLNSGWRRWTGRLFRRITGLADRYLGKGSFHGPAVFDAGIAEDDYDAVIGLGVESILLFKAGRAFFEERGDTADHAAAQSQRFGGQHGIGRGNMRVSRVGEPGAVKIHGQRRVVE